MFLTIPLGWFFLFKFFNQNNQDADDFFFQIAEGFASTKSSFWLSSIFLLCARISPKGVDPFTATFTIVLIFTINNAANDIAVKLYDFNVQLQTILNPIHPPVVHCSLYLTLLFLINPKIIVSFYAWLLAGVALLLGSMWAFAELGWGSFWFYDPIETYSFLYWVLLSCLIPLHIKKYTPSIIISAMLIFFLVYPKFFLNNSLHSFNNFFFENQLSKNFLTIDQSKAVLISTTLLMLASSRAGTKRQGIARTRVVKIKFTLIFTTLVLAIPCLLVPALEEASISRVVLMSTAFYLILGNNKNHNEIGYVILSIFILETWNTSENINKGEFILFKMDEIVSKNHITLTNSISFKQILVDSNKNSSLLKVKEIYYYNIVDYSEDNSIDTIVIPASYALGTAYIGSKAMAGL